MYYVIVTPFSWEQCKLEQLTDIVRGASPRPIQDPKWFDENSEVWLVTYY